MKFYTFILGVVVLFSCEKQKRVTEEVSAICQIPEARINIKDVIFNKSNSLWLYNDSSEVSGYVLEYFNDGSVFRKFGVVNGKKCGEQVTYYLGSKIKFLEHFQNNRMHGEVRRWSIQDGHQLVASLNYHEGKLHGKQVKWYSTGEIHKVMNLNNGKEDGMQQAFRKNGALYANYEARNGRVFGLKRSNLCYELDNEEIVYQQ